mmetsp:Transcript_7596/g.17430  ORF Transcript_7596/g.17430 Transcript_7596/m.17430 type:complete len:82 (-) Transcript_7596:509-754(-)
MQRIARGNERNDCTPTEGAQDDVEQQQQQEQQSTSFTGRFVSARNGQYDPVSKAFVDVAHYGKIKLVIRAPSVQMEGVFPL